MPFPIGCGGHTLNEIQLRITRFALDFFLREQGTGWADFLDAAIWQKSVRVSVEIEKKLTEVAKNRLGGKTSECNLPTFCFSWWFWMSEISRWLQSESNHPHGVPFGTSISISRFLEYVVPRFWALFEAFGEARQMGNFQIFSMRGAVLMIL